MPPTDRETAPEPPARAASSTGKKLLLVLAGIAVLALLVLLGRRLGGYVPTFASWVHGLGAWGPVAFIAGYAVATVAFIPGALLTLAAGVVFGVAWGTLYTFIGATLGASGAFLVSRYLARSAVERRIEGRPKFAAVDRAVAREGWKIVVLLRLSPVFPFNLLNYALGLTKIRFREYLLASVAMLPGTLLYVYYGSLIGSLAALAGGVKTDRGPAGWALFGLGLVATIVVTTLITRKAGKAIRQEVERG